MCAAQGNGQVLRRSARRRTAPEVVNPAWEERKQGKKDRVEERTEQPDNFEGEKYQAMLPAMLQKPAHISADEQTLLQTAVVTSTP